MLVLVALGVGLVSFPCRPHTQGSGHETRVGSDYERGEKVLVGVLSKSYNNCAEASGKVTSAFVFAFDHCCQF